MSFDFGSLAGIGVSAATGNLIGAGVGVLGLGMSLFGGMEQSEAEERKAAIAKQQAAVSMDIAAQEQGINKVKQNQMELEGRRSQLETIRNVQRARAQAEAAAVNQGANLGSGFFGGQAQIQSQGLFNLSGINSALQSGRQISGYNDAISADKIKLAGLGGDMASASGDAASAAGFASLGGSIMKAGPVIGQFSQGFGSSKTSSYNPYNSTGSLY